MTSSDGAAPDSGAEQRARESALVEQVLASFDDATDPRLRELLQSATRHLHAFLREVRPTEEEWRRGIDFLTAVGQMSDERRQEMVLLSDTLGASMQTIAVNNQAYADATEATVFGPFFRDDAPEVEPGGDIAAGAPGEPCWVEGTVRDTAGRPVAGARVEVWEADAEGLYDVQREGEVTACRGRLRTGADGGFRFWAVTPTPYPIPHDGPVGQMLAATGRSPMRPAHLHFLVAADGLRTLVTHIFVRGDAQLGDDAVFGVKESLVRDFERQPPGTSTPDGRALDGAWSRVAFDVVLAPAG